MCARERARAAACPKRRFIYKWGRKFGTSGWVFRVHTPAASPSCSSLKTSPLPVHLRCLETVAMATAGHVKQLEHSSLFLQTTTKLFFCVGWFAPIRRPGDGENPTCLIQVSSQQRPSLRRSAQAEVLAQGSACSFKDVCGGFKLQRDVLQPRPLQFLLHQLWRTRVT